jgi:hypothetical protein
MVEEIRSKLYCTQQSTGIFYIQVTYFDHGQRKQTDVIRHNLAVFRGVVWSDEKEFERTP